MATTPSNLTEITRSLEDNVVFNVALTVTSSIGLAGCFLGLIMKLIFRLVIPVAWKCCLWLMDLACFALGLGLLLNSRYVAGAGEGVCKAAGFFTVFGIIDLVFCLALTGLTHCLIQSPTKMSQLSTFRWSVFLGIVLPQKVAVILLALLPVAPLNYFGKEPPLPLVCFPVREEGETGATFGAILFFITWGALVMAIVLMIVLSVRFYAGPGTRVHASAPSLWQMQKMEQARILHKFYILETAVTAAALLLLTIVVYTNSKNRAAPQWITLLALTALVMLHMVVATIQFFMWSGLCGDTEGQKKEPHHRLKQLELIKSDGRGRLRMKATWTAGKGVWRRGLLKVYSPAHIKAWAQEIVVLGLLRKSQSASVLQCLWTSNTNPYYETMTLISGDIVTSDSRLTCLELTSSGTLHDLLKTVDVPLPEPCQRTIMHDIAEGLSYLHDQNVLHRNLTSAAVYIKGSIKCFVIRAAIGDFEDAQIYGTLLTGSPNSTMTRKRFFFPDLRSYALVGIEMLARVCECRMREKQPHRRLAVSRGQHAFPSYSKSVQGKLSDHHHHIHHRKDHNHHRSTDLRSTTNRSHASTQSFETVEFTYCPPGEVNPSKTPSPTNGANGVQPGQKMYNQLPDARVMRHDKAEHDIDRNWKLQMRASESEASEIRELENVLAKEWRSDSDNDYNPHDDRYKHSRIPGISDTKFEFPNDSIFRAGSGDSSEDLGIIEEEIERAQRVKLVPSKGALHQQAGYVTSVTEDGREIFIPASYTAKTSVGAVSGSSGYGSSVGVYGSVNSGGNYSVINVAQVAKCSGEYRQVHKTVSGATISSFEDDVLEVLPGMADVEERPQSRTDRMLKDLFKAKKDAREDGLIESYEERVRRGELGSGLDGIPDGIVFPKKNKDLNHQPTVEELMNGKRENVVDSKDISALQQAALQHQTQETTNNQPIDMAKDVSSGQKSIEKVAQQKVPHQRVDTDISVNYPHQSENFSGGVSSQQQARPMTATTVSSSSSSITQRMQRAQQRPLSASTTSFREWNARSSMKRNKARTALKRALSAKGYRTPMQQPAGTESRASKAKDVEQKYAGRPGSAATTVSSGHTTVSTIECDADTVQQDISVIQDAHGTRKVGKFLPSSGDDGDSVKSSPIPPDRNPYGGLPTVVESPARRNLDTPTILTGNKPTPPPKPSVSRKPSTKCRPAPPPPLDPSLLVVTAPAITPHSNSVAAVVPETYKYNVDNTVSQRHADNESITSVEPASSSKSESTGYSSNTGRESSNYQTTADKIESDMNEIIKSSEAGAAASTQRGPNGELPPGIKHDSGFETASISSEESCLCAAAALQAVDDGGSNPSDIFSQGTCSCACSNCLETNNNSRHRPSWAESMDSESWSNSNSFSSYEANMYRRKLPTKREKDYSGGVLAPDEQYPSPVRDTKIGIGGKTLHPHTAYSPKRNHKRLSHTRGNRTSSASETSSAASRRYRELMRKGVPLRVSVVAADGENLESEHEDDPNVLMQGNFDDRDNGAQNDTNTKLYNDLERNGFFKRDTAPESLHMTGFTETNQFGDDDDFNDRCLSPIPSLEDIIKEIPDETGNFSEETKAFLNRPDSEISIKAMQAVLQRTGSSLEEKPSHPGELIIDRIFTHQGPSETLASTFGLLNSSLDLDVSAIREVAMLPSSGSPNDLSMGEDIVGLLPGVDGRHVTYCHNLSSQLHLVSVSDLLPANNQAFEKLMLRFQHTGRVGSIGNQILDTIVACWLYSTPPTSSALVEQLSDRITETEL